MAIGKHLIWPFPPGLALRQRGRLRLLHLPLCSRTDPTPRAEAASDAPTAQHSARATIFSFSDRVLYPCLAWPAASGERTRKHAPPRESAQPSSLSLKGIRSLLTPWLGVKLKEEGSSPCVNQQIASLLKTAGEISFQDWVPL